MKTVLNWGVLSTAKIGRLQVIPAMQQSAVVNVLAIASRDLSNAKAVASELNIQRAYGSYEALLDDPDIDAIYNPLPNHLHVPISIQAMRAGKHVLCEKPIALNEAQARELLAVSEQTGMQIEEAFMVRSNPQWLRVQQIIQSGRIGRLCAIQGAFSYYNDAQSDIRNQVEMGGGGIYDIGCYLITLSRMITSEEPLKVAAVIDRDPLLKVDRLASAMMVFPSGIQVTWVCSTQMVPYQRLHFLGSKGRVEVDIPFNAPNNQPNRIFIDTGIELGHSPLKGMDLEELPLADQYEIQGRLFSEAILQNKPMPVSMQDSIANMKVIDAIFHAAETGQWQHLQHFS